MVARAERALDRGRRRGDQGLGAVGAGLEERPGRDPPATAADLLVEPGPRPRSRARRRRRPARPAGTSAPAAVAVDDHEALAGGRPGPQRHLDRRGSGRRRTSSSSSGWATRHGRSATRSWLPRWRSANRPPTDHAAQGGAVARRRQVGAEVHRGPRVGPGGAGRRRRSSALSCRCAAGSTCCQSQPPQPAATRGTAAPPGRARIEDLDHRGPGEVLAPLVDLGGDLLAGQRPGHEHDPAVGITGEAVATRPPRR